MEKSLDGGGTPDAIPKENLGGILGRISKKSSVVAWCIPAELPGKMSERILERIIVRIPDRIRDYISYETAREIPKGIPGNNFMELLGATPIWLEKLLEKSQQKFLKDIPEWIPSSDKP